MVTNAQLHQLSADRGIIIVGGEGHSDSPRSGWPLEDYNPRLISRIQNALEFDSKLSLSLVAKMTNENKQAIANLIRICLPIHFIHARWVPKVLTNSQKCVR